MTTKSSSQGTAIVLPMDHYVRSCKLCGSRKHISKLTIVTDHLLSGMLCVTCSNDYKVLINRTLRRLE